MQRLISLVLGVLVLSPTVLAKETFNVDFTVGWQGCYRPMEWTPIEIGITGNLDEPFGGVVTAEAQQDDLTSMTVGHQFVLTPDLPLHIPLVTKLAFAADGCEVSIYNDKGRVAWKNKYSLWDYSKGGGSITAVDEGDLFIGLVGRSGFGLRELPKHSRCGDEEVNERKRARRPKRRGTGGNSEVYLKQKLPRRLPWDWTGFVSLDLLILYDPDWNMINVHQAKAIAQWVSNGGKLLVILGSHPLSAEHPIAGVLPVELGQIGKTPAPSATLRSWGCNVTPEAMLTHWSMESRPEVSVCRMKSYGTGEALFANGLVGFGRVGVLAFDPSTLDASRPEDRAKFWIEHIASMLSEGDGQAYRQIHFVQEQHSSDENEDYYSANVFESGEAGEGTNAVLEHLLSIPELRPLSIWWVILLLAVLALLLGPIDYLVLKRLKKLPLTWITSACCIGLFTAVAYYGVQALRSGATQVRAVSVVDAVEDGSGSSHVWSTVYSGIFASISDDYSLTSLRKGQWWSGTSPMKDSFHAYGRGMASRKVYCFQHDGANLPSSLPINIWSMQCLICESSPGSIPVRATVRRDGGEVVVSISNLANSQIGGGVVRFDNDQVMRFGSVAAGQSREFRGQLQQGQDWQRSAETSGSHGFAAASAYFAKGTSQRTRSIQAYLRAGAAVVSVKYDQATLPFGLIDRQHSRNHIELVRLVVFPEKG